MRHRSHESSHAERTVTKPRWYLWDGGFLALGRSEGVVKVHAHHAIQIVVALDREPAICGKDGNWQSGQGIIVLADVPPRQAISQMPRT